MKGFYKDITEIYEEIVLYINFLIESVENNNSIAYIGNKCNEISKCYRSLAICELLIAAETDEFFHHLIRSAQTRKYYLTRCHNENYLTDPAIIASFNAPFLDAIVANQFKLAESISKLSPTKWMNAYEYEDDFLYAYFLHKIIEFKEDSFVELQQIINQFDLLLEGSESTRLEICKAFLSKNQNIFDTAFNILINEHENQISEEKDTVLGEDLTFQPNCHVFVEGLALLKIAEKVGLKTKLEYKYCPSIARRTSYKPFVPSSFPNFELET